MKILALDSSTKHFSVAVSGDAKVLAVKNIFLKKVLSSSIIPGIDQTLQKAGLTLSDMDGFAVGLGPGSFTSLRVGLATIKGLAFATGKPVVGISSLDVLARQGRQSKKDIDRIWAIADAKRNLVYACGYVKDGDTIKSVTSYLLLSIEELLAQVKGEVLFIGDGVKLFRAVIEQEAKKRAAGYSPCFAPAKDCSPRAQSLIELARPKFIRREFADIHSLVPLYLYAEDCQVQSKKGG